MSKGKHHIDTQRVFLLFLMKAEVVVTAVQSLAYARRLCDPMDCGPLGSSVGGISQTRILEGDDISFSKGSS